MQNDYNLSSLSIDELKNLRSRIISELNFRTHQQMMENKRTIQIGTEVIVDHPKTAGKRFIVTSMRRTKASIEAVSNPREKYNLPISMMELA